MVPAREPVIVKLYDGRRLCRPTLGRRVTSAKLATLAGTQLIFKQKNLDITGCILSQNPTEH